MKILYYSQYFPPEMGAPAARIYEMSKRWVVAGHDVAVMTAFPHHPIGRLYDGYKVKSFDSEIEEGIRVYRNWIYIAANKGKLKRIISYFSYAVSSVFNVFRVSKPDVIIATSPQFLCAISGYCASKIKRVPFILEIRDVWPDSIVAVGAMEEGFIVGILRKIELFLYRKSSHIVVVTHAFKRYMVDHGIPEGKITVITNGVNPNLFFPMENAPLPEALKNKNGEFVVTYVGTHGMAHALTTVLNVAKEFEGRICFVFIGEGAEKSQLLQKKEQENISNVLFIDRIDRAEVPQWIAASDLCLVHLKKTPLFETVIPSKIFEVMGCGKPLLLGTAGESRAIVADAKAGLFFTPEDEAELKVALQHALDNPEEVKKLGKNALEYVKKHYDLSMLARRYENVLTRVCNV
ncbi:glycosyltransferase family 4 protein [bacterium]|nr:glycosyltransferase family 4 protein [bacterium]